MHDSCDVCMTHVMYVWLMWCMYDSCGVCILMWCMYDSCDVCILMQCMYDWWDADDIHIHGSVGWCISLLAVCRWLCIRGVGHTNMHTNIHNIHTYIHTTYIHTYIQIIHTYIQIIQIIQIIHTDHTYIHTYINTYRSYIHTYIHTYIHIYTHTTVARGQP